ncbi:hypothetical protein [Micromonospora parathelypteridis]|uniref:Uncharacterized protein n=1 Tax=Micromonospora parathelypteridis TaxID=1839617 RepID=A0A840WAJ1_9ACTN|nr:hypothetical protein [Micromonospora parathelypteridis]MBB5480021.1 hypothetical protein [Micromonospora parathelypteridis]GGO25395.1 hypothetical protein GCM10011576_47920 [Micromonospora parathelypteridis]
MTALTVRKQDGVFVLDSGAGGCASLRTGWTWRRGEIRTGAGLWTVAPTDRRRIGVTAQTEHGVAVRLDPLRSHVPGPGGVARWAPGRCGGELVRDGHRIAVRLPGRLGGPIRVDVTGVWAEVELVTLTACFALMSRRRQRTLNTMAVISIATQGPVG